MNASNGSVPTGLRTRGVALERVRPLRWQWARRIPLGLLSLLVGEEGVGKGTFAAWLIARATRGELDGDLYGTPVRVLVIGDEDGFDPIWVPRLHLAGADLSMLRTLDDGETLADFAKRADDLSATVAREGIGFVVFDALLDHINGGQDGAAIYNPKHIRDALAPLRRVAAEHNIATLGLLHPVKARATSFRELAAGSHQLNAVSRSSLLLGVDPDDDARRLLVRGKGNHSAIPRSFEFAIAAETFELNGHGFEMPRVADEGEGDRTLRDLLGTGPAAPVRAALEESLAELLTAEEQTRAALARGVGRDAKDGSVGNALDALVKAGRALRGKHGWRNPSGEVQVQPLTGIAPGTPGAQANGDRR